MHFGRWASAGFLCGLGLAACKTSELNSEHCANNEGDATCLSRYPDGSRPFCGRGSCFTEVEDGCVTDRPSEDSCASPCGGQTYADEPDGLDCVDGGTATAGDDDGGMTTGPTGDGPGTVGPDTDTDPSGMTEGPTDGSGSTDDGPMGCTSDDECTEADAPFCVAMICSACSATDDPDAACAEKFPETPACEASMCVQCAAGVTGACTGTTPICDVDANTCVACTAHDQCDGDAACEIATGECFPADAVFYVDGDAGCPGAGTMAMPWCEIQPHVLEVGAGESRTLHIAELAADDWYSELIVPNGGATIALIAVDGDRPIIQPSAAGSTLSVSGATTNVYLEGLRFQANGNSVAINVSDGLLFAQRCEIVENSPGAILVEMDGFLRLENSFAGDVGEDVDVLTINNSSADIVYSTLVGGSTNSSAIACVSPDTVSVRNSIVVSRGGTPPDELDCGAATITYSATEGAVAGQGNAAVGLFPTGNPSLWFANYATGDYHLQNDALVDFAGVAQWQDGDAAMDILPDPLTDIDGQMRTAVDGSMSHAGADLP